MKRVVSIVMIDGPAYLEPNVTEETIKDDSQFLEVHNFYAENSITYINKSLIKEINIIVGE